MAVDGRRILIHCTTREVQEKNLKKKKRMKDHCLAHCCASLWTHLLPMLALPSGDLCICPVGEEEDKGERIGPRSVNLDSHGVATSVSFFEVKKI